MVTISEDVLMVHPVVFFKYDKSASRIDGEGERPNTGEVIASVRQHGDSNDKIYRI